MFGLLPYSQKTRALGYASLFDAKAMLLQANCLIAGQRYAEGRVVLRELLGKYSGAYEVAEVKRAKDYLKHLDQGDYQKPLY